jgi:hypothetical protein
MATRATRGRHMVTDGFAVIPTTDLVARLELASVGDEHGRWPISSHCSYLATASVAWPSAGASRRLEHRLAPFKATYRAHHQRHYRLNASISPGGSVHAHNPPEPFHLSGHDADDRRFRTHRRTILPIACQK